MQNQLAILPRNPVPLEKHLRDLPETSKPTLLTRLSNSVKLLSRISEPGRSTSPQQSFDFSKCLLSNIRPPQMRSLSRDLHSKLSRSSLTKRRKMLIEQHSEEVKSGQGLIRRPSLFKTDLFRRIHGKWSRGKAHAAHMTPMTQTQTQQMNLPERRSRSMSPCSPSDTAKQLAHSHMQH